MDQGKWHSWELGSAYHRGMDMLGLLKKYLVEESCLGLEEGNATHLRQLVMPLPAVHPQEGHLGLSGSRSLSPQHT